MNYIYNLSKKTATYRGASVLLQVPPRAATIPLATIAGDRTYNANTNLMSSSTGQNSLTTKQLNVIFRKSILGIRFGEREYYRPVVARDINASSETNYNQINTRNYFFFKTVEAYNNGTKFNDVKHNLLVYYNYSKIFGIRQHNKDKGIGDPGFIFNVSSTIESNNRAAIKGAWKIGHK